MTYTLTLTPEDHKTIDFVGGRYEWSHGLQAMTLQDGVHVVFEDDGSETYVMQEHRAWQLKEAFEADALGGHSFFPMLDPHSELHKKLVEFMEKIV